MKGNFLDTCQLPYISFVSNNNGTVVDTELNLVTRAVMLNIKTTRDCIMLPILAEAVVGEEPNKIVIAYNLGMG
jgi:hypothetical protein